MLSGDSKITKTYHVEVFSCHNGLLSHDEGSIEIQTDFIQLSFDQYCYSQSSLRE